jgi:hypothetical protein
MHIRSSSPTVLGCVFRECVADSTGGAINILAASEPLIRECMFEDNRAALGGGVSSPFGAIPTFDDCVFRTNMAEMAGGGVYAGDGSAPVVRDTLLCENTPDAIAGTWLDAGGNELVDECPSPCVGDIDASGDVGFGDLILLLAQWGDCPGCPADLDGDGSVGFTDLTLLLSRWGDCP